MTNEEIKTMADEHKDQYTRLLKHLDDQLAAVREELYKEHQAHITEMLKHKISVHERLIDMHIKYILLVVVVGLWCITMAFIH